MKEEAEKLLIEKAMQGDLNAFEVLVKQYEGKVFAVAYRLCGDRQEGEDLAQEAFLKAWRGLSKFRGEAALATWLVTIVTNIWRDRQRRHQLKSVSLDEPKSFEDGEVFYQVSDQGPGPEALYETKELQQQLQALINELKPEFRMVLVLRDIQGYSYEEVANMTQTSLGTVKSRINRARNYLKDKVMAAREQIENQSRLSEQKEYLETGGEA